MMCGCLGVAALLIYVQSDHVCMCVCVYVCACVQACVSVCYTVSRFGVDPVSPLVCCFAVVSCSGDLGSLPGGEFQT